MAGDVDEEELVPFVWSDEPIPPLGGGVFSSCQPRSSGIPILRCEQERSRWCWAAVTQSVLHFRGIAAIQCEIASRGLNLQCCPPGDFFGNDAENDVLFPIPEQYGIAPLLHEPASLSLESVMTYIDAWRPICAAETKGQFGHYVIINGYSFTGGVSTSLLRIVNPTRLRIADFRRYTDFVFNRIDESRWTYSIVI